MEGPSLYLAAEQLVSFKGKKINVVSGNTKIGKERLLGKQVEDIFSWGKHLVFQFDTFAVRVHFLLFGTFEATINDIDVTGDYKRSREPRLAVVFENGSIRMFNCSIKIIEVSDIKSTYDFSIDVMSDEWNSTNAFKNVTNYPNEEIADVLLDQTIFSGVGNMIKNEILSLAKINPETKVKSLTDSQIKNLISLSRSLSFQFYTWRKEFLLLKHLKIHRKSTCPWCGEKITRKKTGKRQRWSYFCPICQSTA